MMPEPGFAPAVDGEPPRDRLAAGPATPFAVVADANALSVDGTLL